MRAATRSVATPPSHSEKIRRSRWKRWWKTKGGAGLARKSDGVEDGNADGEKPQRKREGGRQTQIGGAEKEA